MNFSLFKAVTFGFLSLTFLALYSCASPREAEFISPEFDPGSIATIGLFPITYNEKYGPPLRHDIRGYDLSQLITRQVEKALIGKGYKLRHIGFPAGLAMDAPFIPLKTKPSVLAGNQTRSTDGLMQVHVTFHYGIYPRDDWGEDGSYTQITLYATARLIDGKGLNELWRDEGRGRQLRSVSFANQLNFAVYTLAEGLFATLPDRNQ